MIEEFPLLELEEKMALVSELAQELVLVVEEEYLQLEEKMPIKVDPDFYPLLIYKRL
jgi:hypothetical protein